MKGKQAALLELLNEDRSNQIAAQMQKLSEQAILLKDSLSQEQGSLKATVEALKREIDDLDSVKYTKTKELRELEKAITTQHDTIHRQTMQIEHTTGQIAKLITERDAAIERRDLEQAEYDRVRKAREAAEQDVERTYNAFLTAKSDELKAVVRELGTQKALLAATEGLEGQSKGQLVRQVQAILTKRGYTLDILKELQAGANPP